MTNNAFLPMFWRCVASMNMFLFMGPTEHDTLGIAVRRELGC